MPRYASPLCCLALMLTCGRPRAVGPPPVWPKDFADVERALKREGWSPAGGARPLRNQPVVGTLVGGGLRGRALKGAFLRHRLFVSLAPIDLPASQPGEVKVGARFGKEGRHSFEGPRGHPLEVRGSEVPARFTTSGQAPPAGLFKYAADPRPAKLIVAQRAVDLVEGGKVTRRWYLQSVVFVTMVKPAAKQP